MSGYYRDLTTWQFASILPFFKFSKSNHKGMMLLFLQEVFISWADDWCGRYKGKYLIWKTTFWMAKSKGSYPGDLAFLCLDSPMSPYAIIVKVSSELDSKAARKCLISVWWSMRYLYIPPGFWTNNRMKISNLAKTLKCKICIMYHRLHSEKTIQRRQNLSYHPQS